MIFQDPGDSLNDRANIDYIVSEGLRAYHLYENEEDRLNKVSEMLEKVGLRSEYLSRYPHEFSGGQRQAVTLLMATLKTPKLLLLDEHTAALDPKTAKIVLDITDQVVTENKLTTLMITHNMADAIKHGNRLIMMHEGRVVVDVSGEAKKNLTVEQLLNLFTQASGGMVSDRLILG